MEEEPKGALLEGALLPQAREAAVGGARAVRLSSGIAGILDGWCARSWRVGRGALRGQCAWRKRAEVAHVWGNAARAAFRPLVFASTRGGGDAPRGRDRASARARSGHVKRQQKQHNGPANARNHQMSTPKTTAPEPPWHGDFAGAATDSVLLLGGLLVAFCVLSGKWWVAAYTGFFVLLATLITLMGAHLDYNAKVVLEERAKAARRAPKPRAGEGYN